MCPGTHERAGKRTRGTTGKGRPWLRAARVEAAQAAAPTRRTSRAAQDQRLAARRGKKRATVAVGQSMLVSAYHLLRQPGAYRERGAHSVDVRDHQAVPRRLLRRLEPLGRTVTVGPVTPAA